MLKKLLSLAIALGLAFSILLPGTFVHADDEEDDAATEEEADAEESDDEEATDDEEESEDEEATEEDEEESESKAPADDEPEDLTIYFYVIGFVVVLILVMYAFTEGTRKK